MSEFKSINLYILLMSVNLYTLLMFRTRNNHLNTELFRKDNLHLNRKGYENPFYVDKRRHVILFLISLLFPVSVNTSVFNRTILFMVMFINILMAYLIFIKFFKCTYVILMDYFLFIGGRLFKYLFLGIFIICKHLCKLLVIIFVMNFVFI